MTNFCTLEVLLVKQKCLRKIAIKLNTAVENNFLTKNSATKVTTRVQAENKKNSSGTFRNRFDPRIDLAPFFLKSGVVFTYP